MPLTFAASTTDRVSFGSAAPLDNLAVATVMMLIYPTNVSTANTFVFAKFVDVSNRIQALIDDTAAGDFRFLVQRATTQLNVRTSGSFVAANAWQWIAFQWDINGAAGAQKIFLGTQTAPMAEPGSYAAQSAGSGTQGNDAAANLIFGNRNDGANPNPLIGDGAWIAVWNRLLTLGELIEQQGFGHPTAGNLLCSYVGLNGVGTQPDLSGNHNDGTVTGATVSSRVVPVGNTWLQTKLPANPNSRPRPFAPGLAR